MSTVHPIIRAGYTYIKDDSYIETGTGALNLDMDSADTEELFVMTQFGSSHQIGGNTTLNANLGLGYDLINDETLLTSSYVVGGTAFTTRGLALSPWSVRSGVSALLLLIDTTEVTARYDAEGRADIISQMVSLKFSRVF